MTPERAFEKICGNCAGVDISSITDQEIIDQAAYYGHAADDEIVQLAIEYSRSRRVAE